jgi:hypothetical protein
MYIHPTDLELNNTSELLTKKTSKGLKSVIK